MSSLITCVISHAIFLSGGSSEKFLKKDELKEILKDYIKTLSQLLNREDIKLDCGHELVFHYIIALRLYYSL